MYVFDRGAEDLGNAPCLRNATNGTVRRIAIEYFRDVTDSSVAQMILERRQPGFGLLSRRWTAAVHPDECGNERAHQPGPNSPLVVGPVAAIGAACVAATILRIAWRQGAQTIGRKKMSLNDVDDKYGAFRTQHRIRKADSKNLVGTDAGIRHTAIHHVVKIATLLVPKLAIEAPSGQSRQAAIAFAPAFIAQPLREVLHDTERVVPERLNLDRISVPRCNHPIADLGVHPGQLHSGLTRMQQTVRVDFDAKPSATQMPFDNVIEYAKEITDELEVASVSEIRADRLEEPQGGVHGVVLRRLTGIRKAIGQHAAIHIARERS